MKLAVLGGSSPFTVALCDALAARAGELPCGELALHGRNAARLDLVGEYARYRLEVLGWVVHTTTDASETLRDATIIVHQVRYGGMELRRAGEQLCQAVSCHADETLGPAALLTAIRLREPLTQMCECILKWAPRATVINLTNPLSVATSWMHWHGVRNVLGACELPLVTARQITECLEIRQDQLGWSYTGLNHRGFLHALRVDGRDAVASLLDRLAASDLAGISAHTIAELGAVPTKYFKLLTQSPDAAESSRAEFLQRLQQDVALELQADAHSLPPSLQRRYLDWYPHAVVPLVIALAGDEPRREVVNVVDNDGITRERLAMVCGEAIEPIASPPPPERVAVWLERFERHERLQWDGLNRPTRDWLHETLASDPLGGGAAHRTADALWNLLQSEPTRAES